MPVETTKANGSATDQLATVMAADFSARSLLNQPEHTLFKALDAAVIARNPGWQVMAQVSLGEFLSSRDTAAYGCVNSKRVDFALMDPDARVVHAIEYQGSGHHLGTAAARDAVKKEALRKAGSAIMRWSRDTRQPESCGGWWRSCCRRLSAVALPPNGL